MQTKTTIEMPDELFRKAKAVAAVRGQSMEGWLTELLRREIETPIPSESIEDKQREIAAFNRELDQLAKMVSAVWQGAQDAVAAIREQRMDLVHDRRRNRMGGQISWRRQASQRFQFLHHHPAGE